MITIPVEYHLPSNSRASCIHPIFKFHECSYGTIGQSLRHTRASRSSHRCKWKGTWEVHTLVWENNIPRDNPGSPRDAVYFNASLCFLSRDCNEMFTSLFCLGAAMRFCFGLFVHSYSDVKKVACGIFLVIPSVPHLSIPLSPASDSSDSSKELLLNCLLT